MVGHRDLENELACFQIGEQIGTPQVLALGGKQRPRPWQPLPKGTAELLVAVGGGSGAVLQIARHRAGDDLVEWYRGKAGILFSTLLRRLVLLFVHVLECEHFLIFPGKKPAAEMMGNFVVLNMCYIMCYAVDKLS